MKSKRVIAPQVVKGGNAVPLGNNFYYMSGLKHKDGGIDIGKNAKTGLEVEDEEVMHLTDKEVKVFSSVPFLKGESPAQKILNGENPTKVFNAQEVYKDNNGIEDDGTKKQNGDKMKMKKYAGGGKKKVTTQDDFDNPLNTNSFLTDYDNSSMTDDTNTTNNQVPKVSGFKNVLNTIKTVGKQASDSVGNYYNNNPGAFDDTIGIASNVIGGLVANKANNKMLDKLKYSDAPIARQSTKLKTTININPQLDKMRETLANYERDVDNNTASSRVSLARKQRARGASMLQNNELYGNKENLETELINKDRLNQQQTAEANLGDYNNWSQGKTAFNNAIAEKRSENTVGLVETLNSGVQDYITRNEKRDANRNNMLTIAASHPNVNPRILKDMGINSITDKMIEDWDKANARKGKKSK